MIVAAISTMPFCFLDAYYLLMERQFRGLYNDVVNGCTEIKLLTMPMNRYTKEEAKTEKDKKKYTYWRVIISSSVAGFYLPLFIICIVLGIGLGYIGNQECIKQNGDCKCCHCQRHRKSERHNHIKQGSGKESFFWEYKWE